MTQPSEINPFGCAGSGDRTVNKINAAQILLDAAIDAYKNNQDLIAITLAGAAEEVFGAMCKRLDKATAVEKLAELPSMAVISPDIRKRIKYLNGPRNNLKHAAEEGEDIFIVSVYDAFVLLARALHNSELLGIDDTPIAKEFRKKLPSKNQA
jgi:hypothetical protein